MSKATMKYKDGDSLTNSNYVAEISVHKRIGGGNRATVQIPGHTQKEAIQNAIKHLRKMAKKD